VPLRPGSASSGRQAWQEVLCAWHACTASIGKWRVPEEIPTGARAGEIVLPMLRGPKPTPPYPAMWQVLAEREAWKLAEAAGLDLVAVLPNFVLGPVLSSRSSGLSVGFIKARTRLCAPCGGIAGRLHALGRLREVRTSTFRAVAAWERSTGLGKYASARTQCADWWFQCTHSL